MQFEKSAAPLAGTKTRAATPTQAPRASLRAQLAATAGFDAQSELLKPKSADNQKKDKPFTVEGSGERRVLKPKKPNGRSLYFFFGYTGSKKDQSMRDSETGDLEDDVLRAATSGFQVTYDKAGTRSEFLDALYDPSCYGIYWSGHGYMDGSVQSSDGKVIRPEDVDKSRRSGNIRYLILAACGSGLAAENWKKALGPQCQFEGWVKVTTTSETRDFTSKAWIGDSLFSHGGMNPGMELGDYIKAAGKD